MSDVAPPAVQATMPASAAVQRWLVLVWALVFAMVVIGGITRLTGSGLSITEWQPLVGAVPPLHEADWRELFAKYQRSPQFRQVNSAMTLSGFKAIFFWEYLHRLVGRAIGVVVLVPWLYFLARRRLSRKLAGRVLVVFALGGLQGLLGWYMVKSGLVNEPRVSHYRLAAHLLLAFVTGQAVLFIALDEHAPAGPRASRSAGARSVLALLAVLALQVVYGAFMAGTHAGYFYSTFPDMNGAYSPSPFFIGPSLLHDLLDSPSAIHYVHRALAWFLLFYTLALATYFARTEPRAEVRRAAALVAATAFVQLNLGALTVLRHVALPLAATHQAVAYLLASSVTLLLHRMRRGVASAPSVRKA